MPNRADDLPRGEPADNPAENGSAADQPERALGLARRHHVIGQRPDLGRRQHAQHADPDVDGDEQRRPSGAAGALGRRATRRATASAANVSRLPIWTLRRLVREPDADVDAGDQTHDDGDGDVHVGQIGRVEPVEKQRVARGFAGHRSRPWSERGRRTSGSARRSSRGVRPSRRCTDELGIGRCPECSVDTDSSSVKLSLSWQSRPRIRWPAVSSAPSRKCGRARRRPPSCCSPIRSWR